MSALKSGGGISLGAVTPRMIRRDFPFHLAPSRITFTRLPCLPNAKYPKLFAGKLVLRNTNLQITSADSPYSSPTKSRIGSSTLPTMKRKTPVEFANANPHLNHSADSRSKEPPVHRQRQPQTSCDFCRLKKLKCDRAQPCSTCVTRGQPCDGPPVPIIANHSQSTLGATPPAVPTGNEQNIFNRLRSLEEAVFGLSGGQGGLGIETFNKSIDETQSTSATRPPVSETTQPDYATACDSVSVVSPTYSPI